MANMLFANNANTTLASSLTAGATSMSVTSATGFPSPTGVQYFYCTLADAATQTTIEIVKVTSVSGTTFAITRGQDGTTGTAFAAGAVVSLRLVRASLNDFPKLDETNTFNADQAISGQLTSSAGLATTGTFTATAPSDGLVMDYATGFGRFSAFAGDGFQWYNAGIANTKLMQLSSSGAITTATWNGATVGVAYGGTGLTTLTAGYIPYGNGTSAFNSSSALYFDGTNLGVGTSSPGARITSNGDLRIDYSGTGLVGLTVSRSGGTATNWYMYLPSGSADLRWFHGSDLMTLDASGNLLVGTTNASDFTGSGIKLLPASSAFAAVTANSKSASYCFSIYSTGASAYRCYIDNAGTIHATSTSITAISDASLKTNVKDLETGLTQVMALKPRRFDWVNGDATNVAGFIAQELEEVLPDLVYESKYSIDENGNNVTKKSIKMGDILPTLVKALQELKTEFDAYVASHP